MRSSSHTGEQNGPTDRAQAENEKRHPGGGSNRLFVIGIGPGDLDHLSARAREAIEACDTIVGYTKYIALIETLIQGKKVISTGMTKEVDRVDAAIRESLSGKTCAVVSSGDPGIYAMAGLVFEICRKKGIRMRTGRNAEQAEQGDLLVEVVPGIPALCSGAALLGAPLTHDFAAVSLSDLLTPWPVIEGRLEAAAKGDFVIVLYNPKSKKRNWQLEKACAIVLKHRPGHTPAGIVTNAMRPGQSIEIVPLDHLAAAEVGMLSTVFIGNSNTVAHDGFMITPRGYARKYELGTVEEQAAE